MNKVHSITTPGLSRKWLLREFTLRQSNQPPGRSRSRAYHGRLKVGIVATTVLELNIGETPSHFHRKHSITQDRGARVIKGKDELWSKKAAKQAYGVLDRRERGGGGGYMVRRHRIALVSQEGLQGPED
jgi:hypothetical protein